MTRSCELFPAPGRPAPHHLRKESLIPSSLPRARLCHHPYPRWTSPFTDYATEYRFKAICREQLQIWDGIRIRWFVLLQQPTPAPRDTGQAMSLLLRSRSLLHRARERREKNINTIDWAASNNICFDIQERYYADEAVFLFSFKTQLF